VHDTVIMDGAAILAGAHRIAPLLRERAGEVLEVVDGGYQLPGRWSFGSGSTHADVIGGGAVVIEHGVPRLRPDGLPEQRIALLPAGQVEVHDTWHTTGLRGSASNDYSVHDVWVPAGHMFALAESHRDEPLYRWPGAFLTNYLGVPLGVAADALDTAMGILDRHELPRRRRAAGRRGRHGRHPPGLAAGAQRARPHHDRPALHVQVGDAGVGRRPLVRPARAAAVALTRSARAGGPA
jgi:alkylation response protein AidB-like acyl-CoA dehydrogenase